jgi:hypothetical protein
MKMNQVRVCFGAAVLVVAAASVGLPAAERHFLFGGDGFGTVLSQSLFWISWRLVSLLQGTERPSILTVQVGRVILAIIGYVGLGGLVMRISPRCSIVLTVAAAYLLLLFIYPQATFGP